jgi:L-threonylcarbamoyladenylate synthase
METTSYNGVLKTRIVPIKTADLGHFTDPKTLDMWEIQGDHDSLGPLHEAAQRLKTSSIPVGFPTETVYGLGADATRSEAVKGIYSAKGRPSDNPLIVHVCDLTMLRSLLGPSTDEDPVPGIYKPLIKKFWPGPLTILLPNPNPSQLAPEVTAGLPSFGARMPKSPLALSLICLSGVPLAAPSANASTKPSPTSAEHVLHDLDGRIEIILDGGPCQVGVESTVVDGLCDPPVVLRPGGVSIDDIRECAGWEGVVKGYKDQSEIGGTAPRAPGMKYKHYSPKAKVVLFEASSLNHARPDRVYAGMKSAVAKLINVNGNALDHPNHMLMDQIVNIGIVRTKHWHDWAGLNLAQSVTTEDSGQQIILNSKPISSEQSFQIKRGELWEKGNRKSSTDQTGAALPNGLSKQGRAPARQLANVVEISLGTATRSIAHSLFSALRELDQRGVDVIYVEGIEDEGDIAAAVMNRLRKAASIIEK